MAKTGFIYDDCYLEHDTGDHHPERPDRLTAIHRHLGESGVLGRSTLLGPKEVDLSLIEKVHDPAYIQRVAQACGQGLHTLDTPDCPLCGSTYEIALRSVGGAIAAVDAVMAGTIVNGFCALRPPGHHAEHHAAMGFCYFNNIAIAAEHLLVHHGLERVAIVDWDVHHGNGTQHHFEQRSDVLFASIHQHPYTLFPGSGFEYETGSGPGEGYTLNIPVMPGTGDGTFTKAFEEQILPKVDQFDPQFILVSAGFDPHARDPLAQLVLTTEMFDWMTRQLRQLAEQHCQGRLVSLLEGGYDLDALADSVQAHMEALDVAHRASGDWQGPEI